MLDEVRELSPGEVLPQYVIRVGRQAETIPCLGTAGLQLRRGEEIVVRTERGERLATILEILEGPVSRVPEEEITAQVVRLRTSDDVEKSRQLQREAEEEFAVWQKRIDDWQVAVELIDIEWTHDRERLLLYVLNERGPECTKLALQAAGSGFGLIEVIPLSSEGTVKPKSSGGCGSGGCGH